MKRRLRLFSSPLWLVRLPSCSLVFSFFAAAALISQLASACRPNPALASIPQSWEDQEALVPFRTHGVEGTFILLNHGASLLRLPDDAVPGDQRTEDGLASFLPADLREKLGFPEEHGICLAIPDVFTRGNLIRLRSDLSSSMVSEELLNDLLEQKLGEKLKQSTGIGHAAVATATKGEDWSRLGFGKSGEPSTEQEETGNRGNGNGKNGNYAAAAAEDQLLLRNSLLLREKKRQVEQSLPPTGRYCNSLINDVTWWNPEFLSKFELLQRWRDYLAKQTGILLILGPNAPNEERLKLILPSPAAGGSAPFAIANYVKGNSLEEVAEVVELVKSVVQTPDQGAKGDRTKDHANAAKADLAQIHQQAPISLIFILGTSVEFATALGLQVHCVAPVVDGGEMKILPEDIMGGGRDLVKHRLLTRNYPEVVEKTAADELPMNVQLNGGSQKDEKLDLSRPEVRARGEFVMNNKTLTASSPATSQRAASGRTTSTNQVHLDLNGAEWEFFVQPTAVGGGPLDGAGQSPDAISAVAVGNINVPFPPQSALSGLQLKISSTERVFYKRSGIVLDPLAVEAEAYRLVIDACDWACEVFIEGEPLIVHNGGYDRFSVEIPPKFYNYGGGKGFELVVTAWDPTDKGCEFVQSPPVPCVECCTVAIQPRGKQALDPGFIMYSPVTGIWRDGIWIEKVQRCWLKDWSWQYNAYEKKLTLLNFDLSAACFDPGSSGGRGGQVAKTFADYGIRATLTSSSKASKTASATLHRLLRVPFEDVLVDANFQKNRIELFLAPEASEDESETSYFAEWSVDAPTLHDLRLELLIAGASPDSDDHILSSATSHALGLREIRMERNQLYLNGKLLFLHGVLHQGYWPESLLTPPNENALKQEVKAMRDAGFNSVRVHMVVFPEAFYRWCDFYGLLVLQDMPSGDGRVIPAWDLHRRNTQMSEGHSMDDNTGFDEIIRTGASYSNFLAELKAMICGPLKRYSSVIIWVLFNEGWGQSNTIQTVEIVRFFDPTRLIDAVSGWNDPILFGDPHPVIQFEEDPSNRQGRTRFSHDVGDMYDVHNYEGSNPMQNLTKTFDIYPFPLANRPILVGEYGGIGYSLGDGEHDYDADASWGYGDVRRTEKGFLEAVGAVFERLRILACKKNENKHSVNNGLLQKEQYGAGSLSEKIAEDMAKSEQEVEVVAPYANNTYNVIGGIYTQWTDVETEINGLVTYDRVPKFENGRLGELRKLSEKLIADYYACTGPPRWSYAHLGRKIEMFED